MQPAIALVSWGHFFGDADLVTAYVAIATAAATGMWAIKKYVDERESTRKQQKALAEQDLQQRQYEASEARQQRAAELVKAVGEARDAQARRWTMSALALYPDESLDLLLATLGEASDEEASAISLALISLGQEVLPKVVKYHRIATQICTMDDAPLVGDADDEPQQADRGWAIRMQASTREILVHLLLQIDDKQRAELDFANVDLSGVNLSGVRLTEAKFRKVTLDRAIFGRANLRRANLRGTRLEGAVFRRAQLTGADLTGARGTIQAVRADLSDATLDQADLSGSRLDAARLQGASLRSTNLVKASLAGARLTGATLDRAKLMKATAHHLSARDLNAKGLDASQADLGQARLDSCSLENSKLSGTSAPGLQARQSRLVNVNLNGADLETSDLTAAVLKGCVLGGTRLSSSVLDDVAFSSCTFGSTQLIAARLAKSKFRSCVFKGTVDFTRVDLSTAEFVGCRFEPDAQLVVDNSTWQKANLDAAAREVFDRATSTTAT